MVAELIGAMGLSDQFEITLTEIRCKATGSKMIFRGLANNFASIKSLANVGICLVDEAEAVTAEAWAALIPTIRVPGSEIWVCFNPRNKADSTWQLFVENPRPNSALININIEDNPYVSPELINEMEYDKETDYNKYLWVWRGLPMGADVNSFIPQVVIDDSRKRIPVADDSLEIVAGFDPAGEGKDYSAIVRRRGQQILSVHKYASGDTHQVTEWAKTVYAEHGWHRLIVDATGSSGVADNLSSWGEGNRTFETTKWKASWKSRKPAKYKNARAESWGIMREWLRTVGALTPDKDWDEIPTVGFKYGEKEQIQLESKSKLRKSPDVADALALSLWYPDEKIQPKTQTQPYYNPYGSTIS
jgi:phage terminase large subunit